MRFAYYPGCSAKSTCKELSACTTRVAEVLGVELIELNSASCTGSREVRAVKPDLFLALNARILAMAEQLKLPLMTVCNTCTLNFLDTNKILNENPEKRDAVNQVLAGEGMTYRGTTKVSHFLWMLLEDVGPQRLKSLIKHPLKNLRVAAFYGCHIVRPPAHFSFMESRNVRSIETLNEILGCASIDYSGRTECCGFHTAASNETVAVKLTGRHINSAKQAGADAIVTPCPLCHTVLDTLQGRMAKDLRKNLDVPILHLPQLVGLALGLTPEELQLDRHIVATHQVVEKLQAASQ